MPNTSSRQRFEASCEQSSSYPANLLRTHKFEHALRAYSNRLHRVQGDIFHATKRNIHLWDFQEGGTGFSSPVKMSSIEDLKVYLADKHCYPPARFVFLQTASSRGPMCCTMEQLTYLLSYHQVMPSFVEFCFELKSREDPVSTTLFRQEDLIVNHDSEGSKNPLGHTGMQIQHAFNLLGLEEERTRDNYAWPFRHVTIYHSFDTKSGKAFWIIIKGNTVIRDLITSSTRGAETVEPEAMKTPMRAFVASLRVQLQILEWCTQHWGDYIDYLESQSKKSSALVTQSPVAQLAENIPASLAVSRQPTMESLRRSRRQTDASQQTTPRRPMMPRFVRDWSSLSRMTSTLSTCSQPVGAGLANLQMSQTSGTKMRDVTPEDIFTFDELQALHKLSAAVDKAIMMIDQNRRVLVEILEKYRALGESTSFLTHFGDESLGTDILNFVQQIRSLEGDLDNHQTRLKTLLRRLEKDEALFSGVLQYHSMQVGEFLSKSANLSAVKMEEWTVKMHDIAARTAQETVAMGVITFFTLVLLPSTFVAVRYGIQPLIRAAWAASPSLTRSQTFFSSGIIEFDNNDSNYTDANGGGKMGDWSLREPALKLFLVMSLPLMGISLGTWAIYRSAAFRKAREGLTSLELGLAEKPGDSEGMGERRQ